MKIDFLIDNNHNFLNKYKKDIEEILSKFSKNVRFFKKHDKVMNGDILFILGCDKILKSQILKKHKYNLVIHPSKLPKGRGGAALFWDILKGKKTFYITMFNANDKIDKGDIVLVKKFSLAGNELHDEIRKVQAKTTLKLIDEFLKLHKKIKFRTQKGKSSYYSPRKPKDSELNVNKSLKENFNLLRICSNENYPAFFIYRKKKYILKIFEEE
jgi:methionyl-tRNA formyltransferase